MRNAAVLALSLVLLALVIESIIFYRPNIKDHEHRQRVRVSDAFIELNAYYDGFRNQPGAWDRSTLRLPKHFHQDRDNDVSDMPDTIDYTIDVHGQRLVATFGEQQDDVSGLTVFILLDGSSRAALRCGGSVPVKYVQEFADDGARNTFNVIGRTP